MQIVWGMLEVAPPHPSAPSPEPFEKDPCTQGGPKNRVLFIIVSGQILTLSYTPFRLTHWSSSLVILVLISDREDTKSSITI